MKILCALNYCGGWCYFNRKVCDIVYRENDQEMAKLNITPYISHALKVQLKKSLPL